MLWVGFVVLGNIFVFEILEKNWLSKEEERRRGNGLRKRETKNERPKWWEGEKNKWEV